MREGIGCCDCGSAAYTARRAQQSSNRQDRRGDGSACEGDESSRQTAEMYVPVVPKECVVEADVFRVPYDSNGELTKDKSKWQLWDFYVTAVRSELRQGPGQGYVGVVTGKRSDGQYHHSTSTASGCQGYGKVWSEYVLGSWWLETAVNGRFPLLPVVNTEEKESTYGMEKATTCTWISRAKCFVG